MAAGLIVRDADNNVVVDTTTGMTRFLGFVDVQASGSLSHPGFATGEPFHLLVFQEDVSTNYGGLPMVRVDVSWSVTLPR